MFKTFMSNTVHQVWKFLDDNPCIRKTMQQGLVNTRALAKHIIKEQKMEASLDAIIGALRRYELGRYDDVFKEAHNIILRNVNLSTRNNLSVISLNKDAEVQENLPQLFEIVHYIKGDILRITQANESIKILFDTKNLEAVKRLFPRNKIISIERNLAEINMSLDSKMQETKGILAIITTELAINGVNIVEAITCPPELLWFVQDQDLVNAYNILCALCKKGYPKD